MRRRYARKTDNFNTDIEKMANKYPLVIDLMRRLDLVTRVDSDEIIGAEDLQALFDKCESKQKTIKKMAFKKPEVKATETKKENGNVLMGGIAIFSPNAKAPDFVKAEIILNLDELEKFIEQNQDLIFQSEKYGAQVRCTLKESQKGNLYLEVNTYGTERAK